MINLVYDHQIFSMQLYGGVSRYFSELISWLTCNDSCRNQFNIQILAGLYINQHLNTINPSLIKGWPRPLIHQKTIGTFTKLNGIFLKYFLSQSVPDIIHHTYYANPSIQRDAGKASPQTVLTVYDMIHEKFIDSFASKYRYILDQKKLAISQADHIICISQNTRNDLLDFYQFDPAKVSVVYLGYGLQTSKPIEGLDLTRSPFPFPYVLYVGSRYQYKNFNRFLAAFAASAQLKSDFKVVCFGGEAFNQSDYQYFKELGLTDSQVIYITGNDDRLAHVYKHAQAFIYPSLYEGFGIPPLEAMSMGCPVICSQSSSLPEVVGEAALLCDPCAIDSMRTVMEKLLYSNSLKAHYVAAGYQRLQLFSWEKCAIQTAQIYQSMM